jgi:uncharacterized membrane protein
VKAEEALMRHIARDLADHQQITGSDADESMQGSATTRGETTRWLVVVAAAVLAFVVCVASFSLGEIGAGITSAIVGLLAFGAGLSWLDMYRRRIRQAEREWFTSHPVR